MSLDAERETPSRPQPPAVVRYRYAEGPAVQPPDWLRRVDGTGAEEPDSAAQPSAEAAEFERRLAAEREHCVQEGYRRGLEEGRAEARSERDELLRRELAGLVSSFAAERERYLRAVEQEVVKLSLGIASRILRREAQMDPLLLTGAVRVALGQLAASTAVRLKVPAAQLDLWSEAICLLPNLARKPEVIGDQEMRLGDCVVETELGSVDLGVRAQLSEIERGFFDASSRPASTPPPGEASE